MTKTNELDVVYFVKESVSNEELRYSLRSVEENLPHHKVWIVGGCPDGILPDHHIKLKQEGARKYERVQGMFREVCLNDEITPNFVLMNDDFFVMRKVDDLQPWSRGFLGDHANMVREKFGANPYSNILRQADEALAKYQLPRLSYELHIPMVINREKMLAVLGAFPGYHAIRSLYGNYCSLHGEKRADVKIYDPSQEFDPNGDFLSTEDAMFANGEIGQYLRARFPNASQYETIR